MLQFDLTRDCLLFDEVGLARHKRHEILKPLKSDLEEEEDYKLNRNDYLKTAVVVDFMSMIIKVPFDVHKNINEALELTRIMTLYPGDINQIHVYDSYIQNSELAHRSDTTPLDVVDLILKSVIHVDLKSL